IYISDQFRIELLVDYDFYAPAPSRMCKSHRGGDFRLLSLNTKRRIEQSDCFTLLGIYRAWIDMHKANPSRPFIDIDNFESIDPERFKSWIGYHKEQFDRIARESKCFNLAERKRLAMFLCKIQNATSNEKLGHIFGASTSTIQQAQSYAMNKLFNEL